MSSSSDLINSLNSIVQNLYRYGGPILIISGTVSSIISLFLYFQKNLRQNPCLIYFITRHITNLLFIYLSLLYSTLSFGYDITPSSYNIIYCHFCIYMSLLCDILSPFYLILAAFDRVLFTSSNINIRNRSTFRLACILCISGTIFWMIFHIHSLIYSEILETQPNDLHCDLHIGLYSTLVTYYTLIIKGILTPILLLIFGLWIIKNVRNTRRIIIPVCNITIMENNSGLNDRQILVILMKDIIIYIMFTSIMSIILMYVLITQHQMKNFEEKELENFIRHLGTFCVSIPFCIGYYTNLIVSKTFRNQSKNIFLCKSSIIRNK